MSTNEERRARKAEKRAANKAKRQQRHKNARLDTRGADAVVNDERDILGNNGPDEDLDTDGLFVGLDDVPVNEVPHEDEHVSEPDDGEFVPEPEGNDFVPASEDGDVAVSQQDVSELESEGGEFVPETDDGDAVVSQQDAPESESISEPEPDVEGSGMDSLVKPEFVSEPDVEVPVDLVPEPDDDEFVPEHGAEDEGSIEFGPEFVQEPDDMTRFEAGDEVSAGDSDASQQGKDEDEDIFESVVDGHVSDDTEYVDEAHGTYQGEDPSSSMEDGQEVSDVQEPDDNSLGINMDDPFGDMTEDQLDAELGDFEPEPERAVVDDGIVDETVEEDETVVEPEEPDDVFGDEAMGKALLNDRRYRHPLEDPNSDIISRSEDTGSMFREYDSGQEFVEKYDSGDFEEVDTSDDFEEADTSGDFEETDDSGDFDEDVHDDDLEFVSESESTEHDAKISEDVNEPDAEAKKEETKQERKERLKLEKAAKRKAKKDKGKGDEPAVASQSGDDGESKDVSDMELIEDEPEEKPEPVAKPTRQELKEQRKSDWEQVRADMQAYRLYKKAGNKGPLDRNFKIEEKPADDSKANDKPDAKTKDSKNGKAETPAPNKKPNKRGGMSAVIRESVVEAVWPDFLENHNFIVERDGETWGVGLFFDTAAIGGFNKKSKNDESKGGILEALSSGLLKHLVTEKLMDDECIIFIPCTETMSVIDEYSILYNAEYTLCYVNGDGDYELSDLSITASEVDAILMDNTSVSDWIKEHTPASEIEKQNGEEIIEDVPDDEPEETKADEPAPRQPEYLDDDFDEFADVYADDEDEDELGYDEDTDYNEDLDEIEATEASEEDVVSYDVVTDTIVRTFYSDDLRLEVSTEPFDALFVHKNGFIPFQGNRVELFDKDDSFLGQAISEMVKDYNTQLEGMHYANIQKLRADYYTLANLACSRIAERYDMDNINTEVGKIKKGIDDEYALRLSTQEERAHAETNRLDKEWRDKLDEVGKAAAEKARTTYTDRFLRAHNDDLAHVMPNIKLADETEYKAKLQELHDTRRHDAAEELDKFVNEIVAKLSEKHAEMMAAESELRDAWATDLRKYVDEHRKDEFARAAALAERQRQRSEADIVKAEMIGSLNKLRSEFATSEANWKNHTEAMQAQHEEELRAKDQLREQKMAEDEQEKTRLKAVIDDLSHQLETLDQVKETEYKTRVTQLENESLSWKSELDHQRAKHKRQNIVSATLAIIAILAALSVGFIGGAYVNLKADRTKAQQAIVNEIDEKLEENSLVEAGE